MNEKQAMDFVHNIMKLTAPFIHRENFNGDFERWLEREHYDVTDACRDELYATVYDEYCEHENMDMAPYDLFNQIMADIMHAESDFPFSYALCDVCGAKIIYTCDTAKGSLTHEHWDNGTLRIYCNHCFEDCFVKCNRCGKYVHNEDYIPVSHEDGNDYCYCRECASYLLSKK